MPKRFHETKNIRTGVAEAHGSSLSPCESVDDSHHKQKIINTFNNIQFSKGLI